MLRWAGPERFTVAFFVCACAGMVAYAGLRGVGVATVAAVATVVVFGALGTFWLSTRLPSTLDGIRRKQIPLCIAWFLIAIVALAQTARLTAFMVDPAAHQHSLLPDDPWLVQHCCLTAYTEGARLAAAGELCAGVARCSLPRSGACVPARSSPGSGSAGRDHVEGRAEARGRRDAREWISPDARGTRIVTSGGLMRIAFLTLLILGSAHLVATSASQRAAFGWV